MRKNHGARRGRALVLRPLPAANVSAERHFPRHRRRVIPTLLIDEADSFLKDNEELRGVLNSGHRRGRRGAAHRCRRRRFRGAFVLDLRRLCDRIDRSSFPATLADRSVLDRADSAEARRAITRSGSTGSSTSSSWRASRPLDEGQPRGHRRHRAEMPAGLYNRAADNWRPLLAIATVAGGDWLARGQRPRSPEPGPTSTRCPGWSFCSATSATCSTGSSATRTGLPRPPDREAVRDRPAALGEYGKSGKPRRRTSSPACSSRSASCRRKVRIGTETPSGYFRHQFNEAWERFLSPEGKFKPRHREQTR